MSFLRVNDCLPFEILAEIFAHYALTEDILHPLETLLLVCKLWKETALLAHTLWTSFKIRLRHEPNFTTWETRVPLRLARTENCLLDIEIEVEEEWVDFKQQKLMENAQCREEAVRNRWDYRGTPICSCWRKKRLFVERLLGWFTNVEGGCARWRAFSLTSFNGHYRDQTKAPVVIFPSNLPYMSALSIGGESISFELNQPSMARLTSLSLHGLNWQFLQQLGNYVDSPFSTVIHFEFAGTSIKEFDTVDFWTANNPLLLIIGQMGCLKSFTSEETTLFGLLKTMWIDAQAPPANRKRLFRDARIQHLYKLPQYTGHVYIHGTETPEDLECASKTLGLKSLDSAWEDLLYEDILKDLKRFCSRSASW